MVFPFPGEARQAVIGCGPACIRKRLTGLLWTPGRPWFRVLRTDPGPGGTTAQTQGLANALLTAHRTERDAIARFEEVLSTKRAPKNVLGQPVSN
jgi:hypothetical protein